MSVQRLPSVGGNGEQRVELTRPDATTRVFETDLFLRQVVEELNLLWKGLPSSPSVDVYALKSGDATTNPFLNSVEIDDTVTPVLVASGVSGQTEWDLTIGGSDQELSTVSVSFAGAGGSELNSGHPFAYLRTDAQTGTLIFNPLLSGFDYIFKIDTVNAN